MARDLRGRADRPAALARQAGLGGGVEPQELAALLDAPLHAGQVAGVAGLVGLADRRLEPLALGARGLLRGARLPVLLARLPGGPVLALQLVDPGQLLGLLGVEVHQRGLEPLLADGPQVVADLLAGQAQLGPDAGLGPALQVEAGHLRPVLADLIRRATLASPAHGGIGPGAIGKQREECRAVPLPRHADLVPPRPFYGPGRGGHNSAGPEDRQRGASPHLRLRVREGLPGQAGRRQFLERRATLTSRRASGALGPSVGGVRSADTSSPPGRSRGKPCRP